MIEKKSSNEQLKFIFSEIQTERDKRSVLCTYDEKYSNGVCVLVPVGKLLNCLSHWKFYALTTLNAVIFFMCIVQNEYFFYFMYMIGVEVVS